MTTCPPHWTAYLSALMVPLIAILGVAIAYRQWRTAQNKLKQDLFDKRFSVYDAARRMLASVMTSGKVRDEELFKFMVATREAKWLLSNELAHYLDEVLRRHYRLVVGVGRACPGEREHLHPLGCLLPV
ncbi:hypothetical protein ACW9YV_16510 (plasmid) [Paraburkholderia strydomiana]